MENPNLKWMMNRGLHILGNFHIYTTEMMICCTYLSDFAIAWYSNYWSMVGKSQIWVIYVAYTISTYPKKYSHDISSL